MGALNWAGRCAHHVTVSTILIVDDDPGIVDLVATAAAEAGYGVLTALDGRGALRTFFEHRPDLTMVDIRMPEVSGLEVIRRIRDVSDAPVLAFSASADESDIVRCLQAGADDYLVKPIRLHELFARVEAALRRARLATKPTRGVYLDSALAVHLDRHEVYLNGRLLDLTPKELKLLAYLVQRPGRVVSVRELLSAVWGSTHYSTESVKWHIASLRKKIETAPHSPTRIVTVWGSGYRFEPSAPAEGSAPTGLRSA